MSVIVASALCQRPAGTRSESLPLSKLRRARCGTRSGWSESRCPSSPATRQDASRSGPGGHARLDPRARSNDRHRTFRFPASPGCTPPTLPVGGISTSRYFPAPGIPIFVPFRSSDDNPLRIVRALPARVPLVSTGGHRKVGRTGRESFVTRWAMANGVPVTRPSFRSNRWANKLPSPSEDEKPGLADCDFDPTG